MKIKWTTISALILSGHLLKSQTQAPPSPQSRQIEIELLYNHYIQDGNNSAVTGGTGSEKLTVYGPTLNLKKKRGKYTWGSTAGIDIITSASTDKIDHIVSSASRRDARGFGNMSLSRKIRNQLDVHFGSGLSIESDFFSWNIQTGAKWESKNKMSTLSSSLSYYNDDLRWGRLQPDLRKPTTLIYPEELRHTDWFNIHKRKSYNLNVGALKVLNKRNTVGVFTLFSLQEGLLSTPFHRVYLHTGDVVVERLPTSRKKMAIHIKWNTFVGGQVILKNTLGYYKDDFEIKGLILNHETAIKLSPIWVLNAGVRFYAQQASRYFFPFKKTPVENVFHSSDYDLSAFRSYKISAGIKHYSLKPPRNKMGIGSWSVFYNFLQRTNGLEAHFLSIVLTLSSRKDK